MDHNHSKPEELADFPGEGKRRTSGETENDRSSLDVPVSLASLTPTERTFTVSYMALLVGGTESKHKFWKTREVLILSLPVTSSKRGVIFLSSSILKFMELSNAQYISHLDFLKKRELITKQANGKRFHTL